jgi:hypothetical protein
MAEIARVHVDLVIEDAEVIHHDAVRNIRAEGAAAVRGLEHAIGRP